MGTIMSCIEPHSLFRVYRFNKKGKETKFNNKIVYSQSLKNTNSPQSLSIILSGFIDFLRELTIQKNTHNFLDYCAKLHCELALNRTL